jgi:hypothetical protein
VVDFPCARKMEPTERTLDTTKIEQQLQVTGNNEGTLVVLVMSGALSPVHKMHVHCFEVSQTQRSSASAWHPSSLIRPRVPA